MNTYEILKQGYAEQRVRIAELEACNTRLRNELIDHLYNQMLRCSQDAPQAYEVPYADEVEPECSTVCLCPLECDVYQRWLDVTGGNK